MLADLLGADAFTNAFGLLLLFQVSIKIIVSIVNISIVKSIVIVIVPSIIKNTPFLYVSCPHYRV